MIALRTLAVILLAVAAMAPRAHANVVGEIVAMEGSVELSPDGTRWRTASIGDGIELGDHVRTGESGRARIAFHDQTTISVGDDSVLVVNEQVYNPSSQSFRSLMQLLRGKVRAVVGEEYGAAGSSYEIHTATAIAGVRGTEFIISYDATEEITEVLGISGRVEVKSAVDLDAPGVFVTAGTLTTVAKGGIQSAPRQLDDSELQRRMFGVDFVGRGRPETMLSPSYVGGAAEPTASDMSDTAPPGIDTDTITPTGGDDATNPNKTVGDVVGQPTPAIERVGGAIVNF